MKAYLAGGCFWCVTPIYKLYGVDKVLCGYSGGDEIAPTYEDVKAQKTGHRETIMLEYDPGKISYDKILDIFFANVDPFDGQGQFIDKGFSYTLAIFYITEEERQIALDKVKELEKTAGKTAQVAIEKYKNFYEAEEYHQDYYLKNPVAFEKELVESGRIFFENAYFIIGTAYAGKSTMVKELAKAFDGIACEENYHDALLEELDAKEFPCLTYTRDLEDWHDFIRRTPQEYKDWIDGVQIECETLELKMLPDICKKGKKVFVDTNISPETLKKIAPKDHTLVMLADPEISVKRFFELAFNP